MSLPIQDLAGLAPGTLTEYAIPVGHFASGAAIEIPLIIAKGLRPGPCLWINGQVHGDELHGVFAAIDFVRSLSLADLSGTVIVTSTANPVALDSRQRRSPQDWLDLDQSFPGHRSGSITERIASRLLEVVQPHADCLVSLHTTMSSFDAVVFAAYKVPPRDSGVSEKLLLQCMAQFQPVFVCVMPDAARAGDTTGHTHGSIDYQMLKAGKPAFMIELGGGGRHDVGPIRQGVEGLLRTAAVLGLIERPIIPGGQLRLVRDFRSVTTDQGGLFRAARKPGPDVLKAGESFGQVINLYGRVESEPSFDRPASLIAVRRDPVAHFGDRLAIAAFGYETVDA
jgi:predicted deacylase